MRRPPRRAVLALVPCALLLSACTGAPPDGDEVADVDPPTQEPGRQQPSPTPRPPPPPFEVALTHIEMIPASNAEIVGAAAPPADHAQVELAADRARRVLQRFLDAQFLAEGTRFTTAALHDLLTPAAQTALTPADRRGLGALHLPVNRVATGPASARAQVVFDGAEVQFVTLDFEAELKIGFGERPPILPVHQRGQLTYVETDAGWRVAAADVRLDAPEQPPPPTPPGAQ
jgi:hypothetical protein